MGIVQVNQIKTKLITEFSDLIDLRDAEKALPDMKENLFLTRALAAYSIKIIGNIDNIDAANAIVDGSGDNGIDAIYFHENEKVLYLVQSKWNHKGDSEPENGEIKKFIAGIKDLLNLKFEKFNEKINAKKLIITDALRNPQTEIRLVLAYTAINLSEQSRIDFNEFLQEQNDSNEMYRLFILNQNQLHHSLIDGALPAQINLMIELTEWGKKDDPTKAYYGQIKAVQVASWWQNYGNNLFGKNLRELLGDSDINKEMKDTMELEPEKFWYYNNGITLVCDKVTKTPLNGNGRNFGLFDCKNVQIINGAQTVGSIGSYALTLDDWNNLENISIIARLISLEETDVGFEQNVTKKNNRQNKIENQDFVSLDPEQKRISLELRYEGINYKIMRSGENLDRTVGFDLGESTQALSCALNIDAATLAHREPGLIWSDIKHSRYKQLFNPSITSMYVWNCVQLYRRIQEEVDSVKENYEDLKLTIATYGNNFISCALMEIIGKENIKKEVILDIDQLFTQDYINKLVISIIEVSEEIIKEIDKPIANIFKNFTDSKTIYTELLKRIAEKEVEQIISIDHLIDEKFNTLTMRKRIRLFDAKINGDRLASETFNYWLAHMYDKEKHECGSVANIHHYQQGDENSREQRFILRLEFDNKMLIKFNHFSFAVQYKSVLFNLENFQEWLNSNGEEDTITINSASDMNKLVALRDFIQRLY